MPHTVASSQFLEHWPGGVCRKTGSVMCAGEGTATGTAPCSCSGANRAPPGPTQVLLPWTIGNAPREPPDHTRCIGTTYAGGRRRTDGGRDASLSQSPVGSGLARFGPECRNARRAAVSAAGCGNSFCHAASCPAIGPRGYVAPGSPLLGRGRAAITRAAMARAMNRSKPSAAAARMYAGQGPMTSSSEALVGLRRRYM